MLSRDKDAELPQRFGPFLLFDKIGQGGMAEIFLASARGGLGLRRLVVIKRVLPSLSADPQFSEMLVEEAKLCASLRHQNVVQVFDLGRIDDRLYIAMEYVEGFDLNALLRQCTMAELPLPAEFVFFIIQETLCALDYAHRAADAEGRVLGIIHRDVSPTNVLISCEGEVKLCDFGIARAAARDASVPEGALKGKFAYMSPEQARGTLIDRRADLFAAGILLWELVAGRRLYRGPGVDDTLELARRAETVPLPPRGLPNQDELARIVSKALSKDPDSRYQTAGEMREELDSYVFEGGLGASQLRFAEFLREHFGRDLQLRRRERERACSDERASVVDPSSSSVVGARAPDPSAGVPSQDQAVLLTPPGLRPLPEAKVTLVTPDLVDLASRTTQVKALSVKQRSKVLVLVALLALGALALGFGYALVR